MIKLDKNVFDRLSNLITSFFLVIVKPFTFKYFFMSKIEKVFLIITILQLLLLPRVNSDIKDFVHLA